MSRGREIPVTDLMDVPGDERGPPAAAIARCETHDVLYRIDGACLRCQREAGL